MEGAIDGLVARPNKSAVLLLTCWRYLVFGGRATLTGKTYGRYVGVVSRAKEPTDFWWGVAIYFVGGLCCIGYFLYRVT
jgi:hypothetical protein